MNLYNQLVNLIVNMLFTDSSGVVVISQWQQQVVEFVALPLLLVLICILIKYVLNVLGFVFKF